MLQNIWKKLLGNRKNQWVILFLIGLLLVVVAIPTKTGKETDAGFTAAEEGDVASSEMEKRLGNILSQMQGIGNVSVMMTYQDKSKVSGVVIVAEHGENPVVVKQITEVVRALFDVDAHKIKVIESK